MVLFVALLASDLAFKSWAFRAVERDGEIGLIPHVLSLRLTENTGAVFGILGGQKLFFIGASVFAAAFIGWFFFQSRAHERALHAALSLILAGAMGNLHDRIRFGAVRDMLNLFPGVKLPFGWHWGGGADEVYPWIFNLADVYLLVGIGVMVARSFAVNTPDVEGKPSA